MQSDIQEIQVACFVLGEDLFAVDIMRIREIIRPLKMSRLVKAPPFIEGVVNLRGTVIPVINLRRRFDLPLQEADQGTKLLIVSLGKQAVGLIVDEVTEVLTVPVKNIKPPPPVVEGIGADYLIGVCLSGESMISLLNIDRILTPEEAVQLSAVAMSR